MPLLWLTYPVCTVNHALACCSYYFAVILPVLPLLLFVVLIMWLCYQGGIGIICEMINEAILAELFSNLPNSAIP